MGGDDARWRRQGEEKPNAGNGKGVRKGRVKWGKRQGKPPVPPNLSSKCISFHRGLRHATRCDATQSINPALLCLFSPARTLSLCSWRTGCRRRPLAPLALLWRVRALNSASPVRPTLRASSTSLRISALPALMMSHISACAGVSRRSRRTSRAPMIALAGVRTGESGRGRTKRGRRGLVCENESAQDERRGGKVEKRRKGLSRGNAEGFWGF